MAEVLDDPVQQVLNDSAAASASFYKDAEAAFSQRDNPGAPAAAPAAAPSTKPAAAPEAKASAGKIPGFPGQTTDTKAQPAAASATPEDEPSREYRPGSTQKVHWNKLWEKIDKAEELRNTAIARAELLEKQGKSTGDIDARLSAIQKERDEVMAELERVAVERSPRFEAQFKPRVEAAVNLAKSTVPFEKAERVAQLLAMPDGEYRNAELEAIAKDLTGLKQGRFATAVAEIDKIAHERAVAASNSKATFQQWQAEEASKKQAQEEIRLRSATQTLSKELQTFGDFFKGDAPESKARSEQAREIFLGKLEYGDLARAAGWAAIAPELASQNSALLAKVASLEADLGKLRGAQPGTAQDSGGSQNQPEDGYENMSYPDAIADMVRKSALLQ